MATLYKKLPVLLTQSWLPAGFRFFSGKSSLTNTQLLTKTFANRMKLLLLFTSLIFLNCSGQLKNEPDWEYLILNTGYTEKISDLTDYQLKYLEKIKKDFKRIEKDAYLEAQRVLDEFYGDTNPLDEIDLNGLNLPEDNSETWELYFESYEEDKYLIPIIIFDGMKISGTTFVN